MSSRKALLGRHPLFSELQPEELERVVELAVERAFAPGQAIFQRGDPGTSLFAVLDGQVRIGIGAEDGREVTLGIMGRGELFGEIAAIDGRGRTAEATAMGACRLLVVEQRDLLSFLERHPRFAIRLLQTLCGRLRKATNVCESLALLDVPVRLARLLLQLAEEHGEPAGGGRRITLKLPQQELGKLIAASRESVNKHLRAWEAEGLIAIRQGCIVLEDLGAMQMLGGSFA